MALLDKVMIAAPCPVSWDTMVGDEKVRHCTACSSNVYNISAMSRSEAEAFLSEKSESRCLRLYRRADGTVMTDNCPVGLRAIRNQYRRLKHLVAGVIAFLLSGMQQTHAQKPDGWSTGTPPPKGYQHTLHRVGQMMIEKPPSSSQGGDMVVEVSSLGDDWIVERNYPAEHLRVSGQAFSHGLIFSKSPALSTNTTSDTGSTSYGRSISSGEGGQGLIKLYANLNLNADSRAFKLYLQAKENELHGRYFLASTCYEEALRVIPTQVGADEKFAEIIRADLGQLRSKFHIDAGSGADNALTTTGEVDTPSNSNPRSVSVPEAGGRFDTESSSGRGRMSAGP